MRTLSYLRPAQARAQIRHALFGLPAPCEFSGPTPTLAIEAVVTPFLDPPAHVKSLGSNRIEMLGVAFDLEQPVDWQFQAAGPLFAYHLHQHEVLRLSEFPRSSREAFLRDWVRNHTSGVGWDPHPISLRLFCWGKLLATPGMLDLDLDLDTAGDRDDVEESVGATRGNLREVMLRSMARQVETLANGLEIRLQANHLLSNLMAVVFVGLLLGGEAGDRWLSRSRRLLQELDRQVRPDGGHEERSPMYHSLLLENVLDLLNLCRSAGSRAPAGFEEALGEVAQRMLAALEVMTHADGQIALFCDSAFAIAAPPVTLRGYAGRLGLPLSTSSDSRLLPLTGYLRLRKGDFDLIASVAGPSPAHQPGHAHCDALAFELSVCGQRLVTDTGVFEYRPGERRDRARRTSSHATLVFDRREQAELWSAHRVGGRPTVELAGWDESGSAEATCRGWSRHAPLHRRFFAVEEQSVSITDCVEGAFEEIRFSLPIDPAWQVELASSRARATRISQEAERFVVEIDLSRRFEWTLERGFYYPTFGSEVERFVLVGVATGAKSNWGEATTSFRRMP